MGRKVALFSSALVKLVRSFVVYSPTKKRIAFVSDYAMVLIELILGCIFLLLIGFVVGFIVGRATGS